MTWNTLMQSAPASEVVVVGHDRKNLHPGTRMLLPSPADVERSVRNIGPGQTKSMRAFRDDLARSLDAEYTCPVTNARSLMLVVEAANETIKNGATLEQIAPVWRLIEPGSSIWKRVSFDPTYMLAERSRESSLA